MSVPLYPVTREIVPGDSVLMEPLFLQLQPVVSEMTFAGLYLFRRAHRYRLTRCGDALVVTGRGYAGGDYFLPPLNGDRAAAARILLDRGMVMYGADERFAAQFAQAPYETGEDRDNADYLYLREELASMPGKRFHHKKNRINYFCRRHRFCVKSYAEYLRQGCLDLLEEWLRLHEPDASPSLREEGGATRDALLLAEPLGLQGVVVLVEGKVKAFSLGERLNRETAVCHFEKADPFMDGLYAFTAREFAARLFTDCRLLNREQDLGEPNLRRSKLSYHPAAMVRKYRIVRR